jgi:hypothetical protein
MCAILYKRSVNMMVLQRKKQKSADMGPVKLHSLSHTAKGESENEPVTSRLQERYSKYAKVISTVELIV